VEVDNDIARRGQERVEVAVRRDVVDRVGHGLRFSGVARSGGVVGVWNGLDDTAINPTGSDAVLRPSGWNAGAGRGVAAVGHSSAATWGVGRGQRALTLVLPLNEDNKQPPPPPQPQRSQSLTPL
jgi:hypothetical protein